jgi:nucleotide-binding universal stress UspA family protein
LPYWILGSLSETASLSASLSVLIFKTSVSIRARSRAPRLVFGVDVSAPPSVRDITWIAKLARSTKAHLDVIYIDPRPRALLGSLQERKSREDTQKILQRQVTALKSKGAGSVTTVILKESRSIAHTIVEFSEKRAAWLTITTTPKRTKIRRLLLGSNARHILALTQRPFLSLRSSI